MNEDRIKITAQDAALQKAIEDAINEKPEVHGVLTSWVLVAHTTKFHDDGTVCSTYPLRMMNNTQPPHIVHGLLNYVQDLLQSGYYEADWQGEDEDA